MAALDKVLDLMVSRQMECLILEPGSKPRLRKAGVEHDAAPAPLDAAMVKALLEQIAPAGSFGTNGETENVEFQYLLGDDPVTFRCHQVDGAWRAIASAGNGAAPSTAMPPLDATAAANPGPLQSEPAEESVAPPTPAAEPVAAAEEPLPVAPRPVPDAAPAPATPAAHSSPGSGQGATIRGIPELLERMLSLDASDLHLSSGQPVRMRVHGELNPLQDLEVPTHQRLEELLYALTPERNRVEFEEKADTDFAYELPGKARFRVNMFRDRLGIGAVLRQIPEKIPAFRELGLPGVLRKVAHMSKGLVLVTGPTGSGKSTTLAALVDLINSSRKDHIITIEDPIEFVHPSKGCLIHQREVGVHTKTFKSALRAALREDPDVVLVGEMRDLETTAIAIETAETGHLVLGTLHTTTAPGTIQRLIDQFPGDRQAQVRTMLSESLFGVASQTLVKKKGGGRVAAFEILINTPAIANMIRENKTFQIPSAMQVGRKDGMILLNDSLMNLIDQDLVEPADAYIKSVDKADLAARIKKSGRELNLGQSEAA